MQTPEDAASTEEDIPSTQAAAEVDDVADTVPDAPPEHAAAPPEKIWPRALYLGGDAADTAPDARRRRPHGEIWPRALHLDAVLDVPHPMVPPLPPGATLRPVGPPPATPCPPVARAAVNAMEAETPVGQGGLQGYEGALILGDSSDNYRRVRRRVEPETPLGLVGLEGCLHGYEHAFILDDSNGSSGLSWEQLEAELFGSPHEADWEADGSGSHD
jgi:hypothetical protein